MEAADQQMAPGDDQGTRETVTDLCTEKNVCAHIEGQDPFEAAGLASEKEVGFLDGIDPAFKEAPADRINGDVPMSGCMEKASFHTRKASREVSIGPRCFTSSTDMLNVFNQLLNGWPLNHDVNKYEHMMLEDLLKKGHPNFHEKIGTGIQAFQVRINKEFDSRCFYVIRKDGSMNDFSYRKCVDSILSLPKNLKSKFGRERNQKCPASQENVDTHGVGFKNQHSSRGRKRKRKGNAMDGIARVVEGI